MTYQIWNRRYTGSKYKIADWIIELILDNCSGNSFCDIFAGTGIISKKILDYMSTIYINDFLFSNEKVQVLPYCFRFMDRFHHDSVAFARQSVFRQKDRSDNDSMQRQDSPFFSVFCLCLLVAYLP